MNDINFFKHYQGQKKQKINTNMYIYGALAIVGVLILSTLAINSFKIYSLNKGIDEFARKLEAPEIQADLKEASSINTEIELLTQYDNNLSDISKLVKNRDNVSDNLLDSISSTLPSGISFTNLDINSNTIAIQGVATSRVSVAELKHNLSALSNMQDVHVNSIDSEESVEGEYSFDIKCVLKDVK